MKVSSKNVFKTTSLKDVEFLYLKLQYLQIPWKFAEYLHHSPWLYAPRNDCGLERQWPQLLGAAFGHRAIPPGAPWIPAAAVAIGR